MKVKIKRKLQTLKLSKRDITGVYFAVLVFLALSIYFVAKHQFVFLLVPFVLVFLFVAIFALDKLLLFVVFATPVSIQLSEFASGLPINMFLPTEPLLFGILLLFILKIIVGQGIDMSIIRHPVSIIIFIQLAWILITSFTSTLFFVSIKFFLARLWFVVGFYIIAAHLFKNPKNIGRYVWLYTSSLVIVIGYTMYRLNQHGLFDQQFANSAPNPLYNDHTAYAAALAMIIPFLVGLLFLKQYSYYQKIVAFIVLFIVITVSMVGNAFLYGLKWIFFRSFCLAKIQFS